MSLTQRLTTHLATCIVSFSIGGASFAADPAGSTTIPVDDFEGYTNNSPNRVFETWIDGLGYSGHAGNGSGALAGHDIWGRGTPYAAIVETALIHGGKQSMPFYYYNLTAPFYSEVERTFATVQDWTVGGSNALSLWLRGKASNAADPVYVALEDAAGKSQIAVRSDPKAAQAQEWRQWQLDLKGFGSAGVNLQSIKKLRLGAGDRQTPKLGGTGIVYVDDITVGVTAGKREGACGSIVAWGSDAQGQATPPAGNDFIAVAAGAYFSLALRTNGSIIAWGSNARGQRNVPAGQGFRAIAAGTNHAVAVSADGSLVGWGSNDYGEATPPAGNNFVAVAAGDGYSLALRADGSLAGWGNNGYRLATAPVTKDFIAVSAGSVQAQALRTNGSIVTWGLTGKIEYWAGYELVSIFYGAAPNGNDFIAMAAGVMHGLALKADGSIVAWGTFDAAPPTAKGFVAIAAGGYHNLALKADGSIVGWGRNDYGQASSPAGTGFIALAAGREHSLAIKQE